MNIEVVFGLPSRQELVALSVEPGTTVEAAIEQSGIAKLFPDEDLSVYQAGIWGKPVERHRCVEDGDRVELYRPLAKDPREARRELAALGRSMGQRSTDPD